MIAFMFWRVKVKGKIMNAAAVNKIEANLHVLSTLLK